MSQSRPIYEGQPSRVHSEQCRVASHDGQNYEKKNQTTHKQSLLQSNRTRCRGGDTRDGRLRRRVGHQRLHQVGGGFARGVTIGKVMQRRGLVTQMETTLSYSKME